ncbi:MAG: hypothetical protein KC444_04775 [Nitrosopumilus sp.]|nr:hypothetical protein [Nitrosopumilus sp.]
MLLEKMIFEIDAKIAEMSLKIDPRIIKPENTEEQIKSIVRKIVSSQHFTTNLDEDEIIFEIISITKCNLSKAKTILREMTDLGLGVDRDYDDVVNNRMAF